MTELSIIGYLEKTMKKILIFFIILTLIFCGGCSGSDRVTADFSEENQELQPEQSTPRPEVSEETEDPEISDEEVSYTTTSVDELIEDILRAKSGDPTYSRLDFEKIEYIYVPTNVHSDYFLYLIEVNEYNMFYYYMHQEEELPEWIDLMNCVTVCFPREDGSLDSVIEQFGIEPDEDGVIHITSKNYAFRETENNYMSISFPNGMSDTEQIKNWCDAEIIDLNEMQSAME